MKWRALNHNLLDFMGLLSDEALFFVEKSLDNFELVLTPFSVSVNSFVSVQFIVEDNVATVLSFNYGRYTYLNYGQTEKEIEFIRALENKYFESNTYIELSPKNKLKLLKFI